jgi:hypothetical protein
MAHALPGPGKNIYDEISKVHKSFLNKRFFFSINGQKLG